MIQGYIGLDIGGSNVRIGIMDVNKKIIGDIKKLKFVNLPSAKEEVDENICKHINSIINEQKIKIKAIGISLAANFNRVSGVITKWPNNNLWNGFSIKSYIEDKYDIKCYLEDDANSASYAEFKLINNKNININNLIYLTVSTGIGCGLILNGKIYVGDNGLAGEIGHMKMTECNLECKCGENGCLQKISCGAELFDKCKNEINKNNNNNYLISELSDIFRLGLESKECIKQVFREAAYYLAKSIYYLIVILDIKVIVIGGGVIQGANILYNYLMEELLKYNALKSRNIEVNRSNMSDSNGVVGILELVSDELGYLQR